MVFPIIRREPTTTCYFCGTDVSVKYMADVKINGDDVLVCCCNRCALKYIAEEIRNAQKPQIKLDSKDLFIMDDREKEIGVTETLRKKLGYH